MKYLLTVFICILYFDSYSQKTIWQNCYGIEDGNDKVETLINTLDNKIVLICDLEIDPPGAGMPSPWRVIKLDSNGKKEWIYDYWQSGKYIGDTRILQDADSGFIISTVTDSFIDTTLVTSGKLDALIVKLDKNGKFLWRKNYGGSGYEEANCILKINSGFLVLGYTSSKDSGINCQGAFDIWLFKIDHNGKMLWQKNYGYKGFETPISIISLKDGNYLLLCNNDSTDGDIYRRYRDSNGIFGNGYLIKVDSNGNKIWERTIGGTKTDVIVSAIATSDSGYVLLINSESKDFDFKENRGNYDMCLLKMKDTIIIWQKNFGGKYMDYAYGMIEVNSNYIFFGESISTSCDIRADSVLYNDGCIITVNSSGRLLNSVWIGYYDSINANTTQVLNIVPAGNNNYYIASNTNECPGHKPIYYDIEGDVWLLKMGLSYKTSIKEPISYKSINLYPNPTTSTLTMQLPSTTKGDYYITITDISGREIIHTQLTDVTGNKVNVSSLSSGVYFIKATNSSGVYHAKFLKE